MRIGLACLALLALALPACSALVSPDTTRLTGDAGMTTSHDAYVPPNQDAFHVPGEDAYVPPADDAWVPPADDAAMACPPGEVLCGAGVCANLGNDPQHCGDCGIACIPGATCVSGTCGGGTPMSPLGDPQDCGPQHDQCVDLQVCWNGQCVCRPPYQDDGNGGCVDFTSDPNNCGGPGQQCGFVTTACSGGHCATTCPVMTGIHNCNGACVDVRRDPGNCGSCGHLCSGSQVCALSQCHDATVPPTCNTCPCPDCNGAACCHWSSFNSVVCVSGLSTCG